MLVKFVVIIRYNYANQAFLICIGIQGMHRHNTISSIILAKCLLAWPFSVHVRTTRINWASGDFIYLNNRTALLLPQFISGGGYHASGCQICIGLLPKKLFVYISSSRFSMSTHQLAKPTRLRSSRGCATTEAAKPTSGAKPQR